MQVLMPGKGRGARSKLPTLGWHTAGGWQQQAERCLRLRLTFGVSSIVAVSYHMRQHTCATQQHAISGPVTCGLHSDLEIS